MNVKVERAFDVFVGKFAKVSFVPAKMEKKQRLELGESK